VLREQGIGGDCSTLDLDGIEHRRGNLDLVGLLVFIAAFDRKRAYFFWV